MFGKHKEEVFKKLKALLNPLGISRYYTDDWGTYVTSFGGTETPNQQGQQPEN